MSEERKQTEYVILVGGETNGSWEQEDVKIEATTPKAAVRKFVNGSVRAAEGTYVAVPARSWRPMAVRSQVETRLAFTEAV